jgi:hypothetical protein
VAIVSANAFDKGLDNDVGITPADFITKPVRLTNCWTGWAAAGAALAGRAAGAAPPAAPPIDSPAPAARNCRRCATWWTWATPRRAEAAGPDRSRRVPACAAWRGPLRGWPSASSSTRMTLLIQDAIDRSQTA